MNHTNVQQIQVIIVLPALLSNYGLWANYQLNAELILATDAGDVCLVENLLDRGAQINTRNDEGQTAFDIACKEGHWEVVNVLRITGATK